MIKKISVFLLLILCAAQADAATQTDFSHYAGRAKLQSSKPPSSANITLQPKEIVLHFSEEMDYHKSTIVLYNEGGSRMNDGRAHPTARGKTTIAASVHKHLSRGKYYVKWTATCLEPNHPAISGDYFFFVR
jgi:methionine-rich copper-binding protein CopC